MELMAGFPWSVEICGTTMSIIISDAQGWVEGALETADIVLEKFAI